MAATIRIDDTLHPTKSHENATATGGGIGGVYHLRNSLERRSSGARGHRDSIDHRSLKSGENEGVEDEEHGLRESGDFKKRQVFTGRKLLWLSYQSVGVIYGDIGTSPLYVYSSTFTSPPSYDDLVGILSIVIWTLMVMVTIKYVLIILNADNEGEGGTFSCYSLITRYANISKRDPREASLVKIERYMSGDLKQANRQFRSHLESSKLARGLLKAMGVLAVSMVMADGVLTPAQSVLGAVQGLNVIKPDISRSTIVATTCVILILLFIIQPLGTTKIANLFAPIIITWLAFNAVFGIYNLVLYDHTVLKAFSPSFAFQFMVRNRSTGWRMLGGVLLSFTGVEALFADLGAFSKRAIQLSWLCYTFPCILLAYTGQAAYISVNRDSYSNSFFNAAPNGTLYPALVIAVLAAIVASQAIITATFQLLAQIMKLSYFPQVKVVHTSKIFHGQIYIPFLNWLLMIGTVLIAIIFNNTTSLGNAYGVCVMFVTLFDTCMVSLAALVVWRFNPITVFFPWLAIACLDGLYISSALIKVPDGAWFTLTLAGMLACLFILWRYGKEQQWASEAADRISPSQVVEKGPNGQLRLNEKFGGDTLSVIKGFGIYFDKEGETTPPVFSQFVTKLVAAPEVMILFHLRPLEVPSVPPEGRYSISRLSIPNCFRLIIRHGFMDEVITPDLSSLVYEQLRDFIICKGTSKARLPHRGVGGDGNAVNETENDQDVTETVSEECKPQQLDGDISTELARLEESYRRQVLYIIGKEQMQVKNESPIFRRILLRLFLFLRENTRPKIASLGLPSDRIIEVGFLKAV